MKKHFHFLRILLPAIALMCGAAVITPAQETTGSIVGTVKDANGAAVKGATVTVTDSAKKVVVRTVQTNDDGEYTARDLPVTTYDVTVEASGFKKHIESKVQVDVGHRRTLDINLEVGNIAEVVTVEANPVAVQLTTPAASTVINGDQVRELQINNRNFISLVTLSPGVTNDLDDLVFTGTNNPETQVVNRALISVNGGRSTQNTFTVDGADITDRGANLTIQTYPSVESIGEFQVMRSLYPAESGRSGGGQINVVTRGGGDKFHGSGFEFVRNERLNANDFQTNRTPSLASVLGTDSNGKLKRRPFRYNNYGFTIGGPVILPRFGEGGRATYKPARTFFFFSEEDRYDIRYPTLGPAIVPTTAMKQGIFPIDVCLSASSSTNCTSILPAGTPLSSRAAVSNVAQQYVTTIWNRIPDPTTPATLSLSYPTRNVAKFRQEIIRFDHTFGQKVSMFYRFQHDKIPTIDADGSIGTRSALPFVNQMVSDSPGRAHTLQATFIFNPKLIAEGRFSYGYGSIFTHTTGLLAKTVSPISVNLPYQSVRDVVPVIGLSGFGNFANTSSTLTGFSNYIDPSWKKDWSGSLTSTRGTHTMKFGAMFTRADKFENALSGANQGSFSTFSNTVTSVASPACVRATGIASTSINTLYQNWACFLLGNNVSFSQTNLDATIDFYQNNWQAFGQDEWRFRKNLTLSYGVRWSYFGPLIDRKGLLSNFDPSLWNPAAAPQVTGAGNRVSGTGNYCNGIIQNTQNIQTGPAAFNCAPTASQFGKAVYKVSKHDFAPRFGIAWDPFGKGTTSIRTGYGIYYEQIPYSSIELQALNAPYLQTISQTLVSLDQPIPAGASPTIVAAATVSNVRGIQKDFKTPYMQHWSLDFQHQFGKKTVVTAGYFGSKGTHLIGFTELNDLPPGKALVTQCATGANTLQNPGAGGTVLCQTPGTVFTSSASEAILDQIRPFRGFRSLDILTPRYNSNYHALQIFATRRFSGASQFNLAYTWSKNLTDNQTSSVSTAPQDPGNIKAEYSRAILDRRHVLSGNYIYEIPFFSKRHDLVGNVLGGWQASGIITYNTGLPFTVASSSYDPSGIGLIPSIHAGGRPYLLCDPNANAPHTVDQWFNQACFSLQQPAGTTGLSNAQGNAPRGAVNGPPTKRVDFTMTKSIRFSESVKLQLRAEAFNVFNHTNFRNLSTSRSIANQQSCVVNGTTFCSGIGSVTSFRDPRIIQLGAKLYF